MSTEKLSVEISESYGDAAINALRNGGKWEWSPDCAIDGIFIPYNCGGDDGCKTFWHSKWYVFGIRIEDGHLYQTLQSCDSDGNWEYEDECDVDDPRYKEWKKQYDWSVHEKIIHEYSKWVVRHGEDPLGEFMVTRTKKRFRQVTVHLVDGQFVVKNPNGIHPQVREYLNLEGNRLAEIDWNTIEEFVEKAHVEKIIRKTRNSITILVETIESIPERQIRAELRKKAKKHLSER
jgi:hypothetical protein